jgi:ribosomal protein S12 methylthiotransferase accessory factor YcaO
MHGHLWPHGQASRHHPHSPTVNGVAAHLAEAAAALHSLGEADDRESTAIWWTARQATDTALGVLNALGATPGPRRLELLRDSVRAARGTVESGKTAIYRSTGNRLS